MTPSSTVLYKLWFGCILKSVTAFAVWIEPGRGRSQTKCLPKSNGHPEHHYPCFCVFFPALGEFFRNTVKYSLWFCALIFVMFIPWYRDFIICKPTTVVVVKRSYELLFLNKKIGQKISSCYIVFIVIIVIIVIIFIAVLLVLLHGSGCFCCCDGCPNTPFLYQRQTPHSKYTDFFSFQSKKIIFLHHMHITTSLG